MTDKTGTIEVKLELTTEEIMAMNVAISGYMRLLPADSRNYKALDTQRDKLTTALGQLRSRQCQTSSTPNPPSS